MSTLSNLTSRITTNMSNSRYFAKRSFSVLSQINPYSNSSLKRSFCSHLSGNGPFKNNIYQRHRYILMLRIQSNSKRTNFSFAGPRKLEDILKTELIQDKSKAEVTDIWMTYHEQKEGVFGSVIPKTKGETVLKRAQECPFFVQPIFREGGFFTLLSQFQTPSHFFIAYLEDFKMDPNRAQPLITCSIFSDLSDELGIHLVRCDVINKGLQEIEGFKATENILDMYFEENEYKKVEAFNKKPESFDFDDYISCQNQKWRGER